MVGLLPAHEDLQQLFLLVLGSYSLQQSDELTEEMAPREFQFHSQRESSPAAAPGPSAAKAPNSASSSTSAPCPPQPPQAPQSGQRLFTSSSSGLSASKLRPLTAEKNLATVQPKELQRLLTSLSAHWLDFSRAVTYPAAPVSGPEDLSWLPGRQKSSLLPLCQDLLDLARHFWERLVPVAARQEDDADLLANASSSAEQTFFGYFAVLSQAMCSLLTLLDAFLLRETLFVDTSEEASTKTTRKDEALLAETKLLLSRIRLAPKANNGAPLPLPPQCEEFVASRLREMPPTRLPGAGPGAGFDYRHWKTEERWKLFLHELIEFVHMVVCELRLFSAVWDPLFPLDPVQAEASRPPPRRRSADAAPPDEFDFSEDYEDPFYDEFFEHLARHNQNPFPPPFSLASKSSSKSGHFFTKRTDAMKFRDAQEKLFVSFLEMFQRLRGTYVKTRRFKDIDFPLLFRSLFHDHPKENSMNFFEALLRNRLASSKLKRLAIEQLSALLLFDDR